MDNSETGKMASSSSQTQTSTITENSPTEVC